MGMVVDEGKLIVVLVAKLLFHARVGNSRQVNACFPIQVKLTMVIAAYTSQEKNHGNCWD